MLFYASFSRPKYMSIFAFNHNHIGVELAETIDSTYIRCDAHQKKCM
jgi:hypothetical protein